MKKRIFLVLILAILAILVSCNDDVEEVIESDKENLTEVDDKVEYEDLYNLLDMEEYSEYPNQEFAEEYSEIIISIPYVSTPPGDIAMEYIIFMNDYLYARTAFTYRELETAHWIVDTLLEIGFDEADIIMQEFSRVDATVPPWCYDAVKGLVLYHAQGREIRDYSQNVILTIPGRSEQTIIVGAHYDTWSFPGAVDNASGVALILESARRMRYLDNYHTLTYIFFGAEEVGCLGARYYVLNLTEEERDNTLLMVNADLLFEGPHLIYTPGVLPPGGSLWGPVSENHITRAWSNIAGELNELHNELEFITHPEGVTSFGSDHLEFYRVGIPVVMFSGMYIDEYETISRRHFLHYWTYDEDGNRYGTWIQEYQEGAFYLATGILHSQRDCFHFINENWPGKMERAVWAYGLFLEAILLQQYN